jgi:hypothetical protein
MNKIKKTSSPLEKFAKVTTGIKPYQTGKGVPKQSREIVDKKPFTSYYNPGSWLPLIRGTQINRYLLKWDGEFINYGEWLAEPRNPNIFFEEKIFIRRTDDNLFCALDNNRMIGVNSIHCIQSFSTNLSNSLLLAILNSKLCNWYFQKENFHMVGKPLAEVKVIFVERLPIKLPELDSPLSDFSNTMTKLTNQLFTQTVSFSSYLKEKYFIEISTKLQNWPSLDFKGFLGELKKAKVKLSLGEEAEWMAYFNEQRAKAQALQSEINRLDAEIDALVYALYGLTEEEIRIVEGGDFV